jgi:drug/metabolite transporter (DMT)-like permease
MLAAWRVLLSALFLLPAYYLARKKYGDESIGKVLMRSLIPGVILSVHFIAWVAGARLTPAANATLIVNLMPLVMPFLMYFMYQEKLHKHEFWATGLAMAGLFLLSINDISISREHFKGDVLCFVSMLLFAAYLSLARKNLNAVASLWLYIVPMYLVAGVCSLIIAAATGPIMPTMTPYNVTMVVMLALVSTVIGHSALNLAMQKMRGQTVTLMNLLQFVIAGLVGYKLYQEIPSTLFYIASAMMLCALLVVILKSNTNKPT